MPEPAGQVEPSLDDVRRSVKVPASHWWRRMLAFAGPAYMVSVGYMDPGNWAADLEGGSAFGYRLIWVLLLANAMAVLLQTLSARLGLVTGRDLAQACRDDYPPAVRYALFVLCEVAIIACDLAEVLGSAVGLNLLFGLPVLWGVIITGADVLLLLLIQHLGIRKMEAFIVVLISTIGLCFVLELFLSRPSPGGVAAGFVPHALSGRELYVAIAILGATVMPHNLYLHSALVQSRDVARSRGDVAQACRFNLIDSAVALNLAFLVNAAILVVAAATFCRPGVPPVIELQQAHELLHHLLGPLAPAAFALALLCAGQSSTVTGTLAGQITMQGFLNLRLRPWLQRLVTRLLAIVPAVIVILAVGEGSVYRLLILSQVVLCLQLPFAIVPLVRFTSSRQKMGPFASPRVVQVLAWAVAAGVIALNAKLAAEEVAGWVAACPGGVCCAAGAAAVLVALALAGLLAWMIFRRERPPVAPAPISAETVLAEAAHAKIHFARIGVALEARPIDAAILAEAVALAKAHSAELVLMHIVEGVGGQWYGPQTGDYESRIDERYLQGLAERLTADLSAAGVPPARAVLGFGNVPGELVRMARRERLDLMVMGSHGHRGLSDVLYGQTFTAVRHALKIPVLAVRQ